MLLAGASASDTSEVTTRADRWSRWPVTVVGALYVLGVAVTALYCHEWGIAEFELLRAQHVIIGLGIVCYVALPLLHAATPALWRKLQLPYPERRAVALAASASIVFVSLVVSHGAISQFVPGPKQDLYPGIPVLGFWNVYRHPLTLVELVIFWIPAYLLVLTKAPCGAPLRRYRLWTLLCFGAVSVLFSYSKWVYPNIDRAVGGGALALVELELTAPLQALPSPWVTDSTGLVVEFAALSYQSLTHYYFLSEGPSVTAIPASQVKAMRYRPDRVGVAARITKLDWFRVSIVTTRSIVIWREPVTRSTAP